MLRLFCRGYGIRTLVPVRGYIPPCSLTFNDPTFKRVNALSGEGGLPLPLARDPPLRGGSMHCLAAPARAGGLNGFYWGEPYASISAVRDARSRMGLVNYQASRLALSRQLPYSHTKRCIVLRCLARAGGSPCGAGGAYQSRGPVRAAAETVHE
jgi:hypothetical protein